VYKCIKAILSERDESNQWEDKFSSSWGYLPEAAPIHIGIKAKLLNLIKQYSCWRGSECTEFGHLLATYLVAIRRVPLRVGPKQNQI